VSIQRIDVAPNAQTTVPIGSLGATKTLSYRLEIESSTLIAAYDIHIINDSNGLGHFETNGMGDTISHSIDFSIDANMIVSVIINNNEINKTTFTFIELLNKGLSNCVYL